MNYFNKFGKFENKFPFSYKRSKLHLLNSNDDNNNNNNNNDISNNNNKIKHENLCCKEVKLRQQWLPHFFFILYFFHVVFKKTIHAKIFWHILKKISFISLFYYRLIEDS